MNIISNTINNCRIHYNLILKKRFTFIDMKIKIAWYDYESD